MRIPERLKEERYMCQSYFPFWSSQSTKSMTLNKVMTKSDGTWRMVAKSVNGSLGREKLSKDFRNGCNVRIVSMMDDGPSWFGV